MKALIYQTPKSSTQSGAYKSSIWLMEFTDYSEEEEQYIFNIMNWQGGTDTLKTIKMRFETEEEASKFASKHGLQFVILRAKNRRIRPKSYASNFT